MSSLGDVIGYIISVLIWTLFFLVPVLSDEIFEDNLIWGIISVIVFYLFPFYFLLFGMKIMTIIHIIINILIIILTRKSSLISKITFKICEVILGGSAFFLRFFCIFVFLTLGYQMVLWIPQTSKSISDLCKENIIVDIKIQVEESLKKPKEIISLSASEDEIVLDLDKGESKDITLNSHRNKISEWIYPGRKLIFHFETPAIVDIERVSDKNTWTFTAKETGSSEVIIDLIDSDNHDIIYDTVKIKVTVISPKKKIKDISKQHKLEKTYSGTYNYNGGQGLTALNFMIYSCNENGEMEAIFSFHEHPDNKGVPSGSYKMHGMIEDISDNIITVSFVGTEWINRPDGYSMLDFDGEINLTNQTISSENHNLQLVATVDNEIATIKEMSNYDNIVKTYYGTYSGGQGLTALDFMISSCNDNGEMEAIFSFHEHPDNKGVPSGSYKMHGMIEDISNDIITVSFVGTEWINRPDGYSMLDFDGEINLTNQTFNSQNYNIQLIAE